jgi:hypothetical protein
MPLNSCIVVSKCSSSDFRLKKVMCHVHVLTAIYVFPVLKPTGNFILVVPIFLL